jgi:hypothetical protein
MYSFLFPFSSDNDEPIFHRCEAHRYDKMSVGEAAHFRGMKQLLAAVEPGTDANTLVELKERTHSLCARFIGGAWKNVPVSELKLHRIKCCFSHLSNLAHIFEC